MDFPIEQFKIFKAGIIGLLFFKAIQNKITKTNLD